MNLIKIENVSKAFPSGLFGQKTVLREVNLTIRQGELVWLRGDNGAGKSTLLKILLGLQPPDRGRVRIDGAAPTDPQARLQMSTVFQEVNPPQTLKVRELIEVVGQYYPNARSTAEILDIMGLTDRQNTLVKDLSGGWKQRLYIALALVGQTRILILDEPTKGLDPGGQELLWQQVEALRAKGVTIVLVTHIQSDRDRLEAMADRIITVADGMLTQEPTSKAIAAERPTDPVFPPLQTPNPLRVLAAQTRIELLQLVRSPLYLALVLLFSALVAVMPNSPGINASQTLVYFSGVSLLMVSLDRLSNSIALERVEGWLKLLKVTPLPSGIYILAKLLLTLVLLVSSLVVIFTIGVFKFELALPFSQWLTIWSSLLLGAIPFAMIGMTLGYTLPPKVLNPISALLLLLAIAASGTLPIPYPDYLQDAVVMTPFFHYAQLIQSAVEVQPTVPVHWWISVLWLILYTAIASLTAQFAYQRDRVAV